MSTLYDELGLGPHASAEEVRAAYRRLSMKLHPDRCPGDEKAAERYRRVQEAYEVLSDPERRAHYDATGDASPHPEADQELRLYLLPALLRVIHQCTGDFQPGVERCDLVTMMSVDLRRQQTQVDKSIEDMRRDEKTLNEVLARLTTAEGEVNVFEEPLRSQLKEIAALVVRARSDLDKLQRALDYLKKCRYKSGTVGKLVIELPGYNLSSQGKRMLGIEGLWKNEEQG